MAKKQKQTTTPPQEELRHSVLDSLTTEEFVELLGNFPAPQRNRLAQIKEARANINAAFSTFRLNMKDSVSVKPSVKSTGLMALNIVLSDLHLAKIVYDVNGKGQTFNTRIVHDMLRRFFDKALSMLLASPQSYDEINVFCLGDLIEGDGSIFSSQMSELETDIFTQVFSIANILLIELSRMAAVLPNGRINLYGVPGNHGEIRRSAGSYTDVKANWDTLIYRYLEHSIVRSREVYKDLKNVQIDYARHNSLNLLSVVKGWRFLSCHNIQRTLSTAAGKTRILAASYNYAGQGDKGDVAIILTGDYHEHQMVEVGPTTVIRSGCLPGGDEYARNNHFIASPSSQVIFATSPMSKIEYYIPYVFE